MVLFKGSLSWIILLSWLKELGGESFLIRNVRLQKCIHASSHKAEKLSLSDCKLHSPQHRWIWDGAARAVVNQDTRECLAVSKAEESAVAQLESCGEGAHQAWSCSRKGHLTLQGRSLHLSVKPGGHNAFLSQEKDRFSKWTTGTDTLVCAMQLARAPGPSEPRETHLDGLEEGEPENKTAGSLEIFTPSAKATTFLMIHLEGRSNVTSSLPMTKDRHPEADNGLSWRIALLVLSPLAFILGVVILMINIQSNKKKRLLTLKNRQVSFEEHRPSSGTISSSSKTQIIPVSSSPLLKPGEILIEWKDGTITSLF